MKKLLLLLSLVGLLMSCDLLFGPKEEEPVIGVAPVGLEEIEESIFKAAGKDFTEGGFSRYLNWIPVSSYQEHDLFTVYYINQDKTEIIYATLNVFGEDTDYEYELASGVMGWCSVVKNPNYDEDTSELMNEDYYEATSRKSFLFAHTEEDDDRPALNMWYESSYNLYAGFFIDTVYHSRANFSIHPVEKNSTENKLYVKGENLVKKLNQWYNLDDSYEEYYIKFGF